MFNTEARNYRCQFFTTTLKTKRSFKSMESRNKINTESEKKNIKL